MNFAQMYGIPFENDKICILLYADDVVVLGEDEALLQYITKSHTTMV